MQTKPTYPEGVRCLSKWSQQRKQSASNPSQGGTHRKENTELGEDDGLSFLLNPGSEEVSSLTPRGSSSWISMNLFLVV